MIFQPKKRSSDVNVNICIENHVLSRVQHCKFLGVIIDEKLSWKEHVLYIKNKLSKNIGILFRCRFNLCLEHLQVLYRSLIEPYLFYCCIIWSGACSSTLDTLIKMQKRALRCICFLPKFASTAAYFHDLCIFKLPELRMYSIALFMYKFHHRQLPHVFDNFFQYNYEVHRRTTRQSQFLHPPRFKSTFSKQFVKYSGVIIWNDICTRINPSVTPSTFKKHIRSYIISKQVI